LQRERVLLPVLAVLAASPILAIASWSFRHTATQLADGCATWGQPSGETGAISVSIGPDDPCKVKSVHSESKAELVIRTAAVPGTLFAFTLLAVAGAALWRRRLILVGAAGILAETLVVFTIAPLTVVVGAGFLLLARRVR
jgi:hypothetical protein